MEEYKPNSRKSKENSEKHITPVITGSAKTKKKSDSRKLMDIFISEDASNVKSYIVMDVLVPAIKKAVDDIVSDGIHMILYGGKGRDPRRSGNASRVSYGSYYSGGNNRREEHSIRAGSAAFDYDNIVFDSRGDAELVLSSMDDIIDQYKIVSVADLYDLAGVSTSNYAVNKYGWTDIHNASVVRVPDGWTLKLPRAMPLN